MVSQKSQNFNINSLKIVFQIFFTVSHSRISQTIISKKFHPVVPTVSQDRISLRARPPTTKLRDDQTTPTSPQIYRPPTRQATAMPQNYKPPIKMKSSSRGDNRAFNYGAEDDRGDMGPPGIIGDNSNNISRP
jgi:hypothetical protein